MSWSVRLSSVFTNNANVSVKARRGISVLRNPGLVRKFDDDDEKERLWSYEVLFLAFADYALRTVVSVERGFRTVLRFRSLRLLGLKRLFPSVEESRQDGQACQDHEYHHGDDAWKIPNYIWMQHATRYQGAVLHHIRAPAVQEISQVFY